MKGLYRAVAVAGVLGGVLGLSGCLPSVRQARQGTAEHEVLTLTPVPEDKILITLRGVDGVQIWELERAIEERFPQVEIAVSNNTWIQADLANDKGQDIILVPNSVQVSWDPSEKFVDLSGKSFTQNYYLSSMWDSAAEDGLFFLPGPSNIYGLVYNKDMFQRYGWQPPSTLDEFIELCRTIEAQGIRAIQPALAYTDATRQFFTGFSYEPVLAGLENRTWYANYRAGKTGMKGHMEPAFEIMKRFVDAGILRPGDFDVKPARRSDMMYVEESCAMILETQDAVKYRLERGGENAPRIGMLPFLSGNGPDSDYLLSVPNYFMAANKGLEEPGNEKKLEKVMEIFAFLSTPQGQKAAISPDSTRISSVRGLEWDYSDFLDGVRGTIEKGNVVRQPFFLGDSTTEVDKALRENLQLFSQGSLTPEEVMDTVDETRDRVLQEDYIRNGRVIGRAAEDFTVLQTAQLFADIFREKTGAQIGLCMANTKMGGCLFRLYEGDLAFGGRSGDSLEHNIEEGFPKTGQDKEENRLIKIRITGEALLQILNEIYASSSFYPDAYWTASGLKITFAPWAGEGSRIVSVTLADGSAILTGETYTVAVWSGTVNPERITEVEARCDASIAELFRARVEARGVIKPELDEYFILRWEDEK